MAALKSDNFDSSRNYFSIVGYLAFNEDGLTPTYQDDDNPVIETTNEHLKHLKKPSQARVGKSKKIA